MTDGNEHVLASAHGTRDRDKKRAGTLQMGRGGGVEVEVEGKLREGFHMQHGADRQCSPPAANPCPPSPHAASRSAGSGYDAVTEPCCQSCPRHATLTAGSTVLQWIRTHAKQNKHHTPEPPHPRRRGVRSQQPSIARPVRLPTDAASLGRVYSAQRERHHPWRVCSARARVAARERAR